MCCPLACPSARPTGLPRSLGWSILPAMAKSKRRKKVKRRSASAGRSAPKVKGSRRSRPKGGSMMSMRSGFKGIAGSLVGKETRDSKTSRFVNIFWWVVTIAIGIVAAVVFYQKFVK